MTSNGTHDDALDAVIRARQPTGHAAVDALNSTVPQADRARRNALEQRLLARVLDTTDYERNRPMIHTPALPGANFAPRRIHISTSLLLSAVIFTLCAAVLLFANLTPPDDSPPAVAPLNQDQDATQPPTPTPSATPAPATDVPIERTATPLGAEQTVVMTFRTPEHVPDAVFDTVLDGETLLSFADRNGVPVDNVIRLNNLNPDQPLTVGAQLLVSIVPTPTPTPLLMTATPVPYNIDVILPTISAPDVGQIAPPSVWFAAARSVAVGGGSGLMISIGRDRLQTMNNDLLLVAGGTVDFFTALSVREPSSGEDAALYVPVAAGARVMDVNPERVIVWVSLEQGVVLNWLLQDTPAVIAFDQAG